MRVSCQSPMASLSTHFPQTSLWYQQVPIGKLLKKFVNFFSFKFFSNLNLFLVRRCFIVSHVGRLDQKHVINLHQTYPMAFSHPKLNKSWKLSVHGAKRKNLVRAFGHHKLRSNKLLFNSNGKLLGRRLKDSSRQAYQFMSIATAHCRFNFI